MYAEEVFMMDRLAVNDTPDDQDSTRHDHHYKHPRHLNGWTTIKSALPALTLTLPLVRLSFFHDAVSWEWKNDAVVPD